VVLAAAALAAGCVSPRRPETEGGTQPAGPRTVRAEWHDLDAAVAFAARELEYALVRADRDPTLHTYNLLSVRDEPVTIFFSRAETGPNDAAQPVRIEIHVGRFGDEDRERALARTLENRLQALVDID